MSAPPERPAAPRAVGAGYVRTDTLASRQRLFLLARVVVVRYYRYELTLPEVARGLGCSPRQLQRAYEQFSSTSFREDLHTQRMGVAAQLLVEQRSLPVASVARLVGYSHGPHFSRMFRRRYGLSPARFRRAALAARDRRQAMERRQIIEARRAGDRRQASERS